MFENANRVGFLMVILGLRFLQGIPPYNFDYSKGHDV